VPHLTDIATLSVLLRNLGVDIHLNGHAPGGGHAGRVMDLTASDVTDFVAPYEFVSKMRAGILVLGPLLARFGKAEVSLPGGCAIGSRPVDMHIEAMRNLGAEIDIIGGFIRASVPDGMRGGRIEFSKVSVGATENAVMAAVLAKGETVIENAACEPEVTDLVHCLVSMGARIEGAGTHTLHIEGVPTLSGCAHTVVADRIETGTYAIAAAITGGELDLLNTNLDHLSAFANLMGKAGVDIRKTSSGLRVCRLCKNLYGTDMMTEPHPGFPTDLQAQFMAMMTVAEGASMITETIFENRFMHVPELRRMGADINVHHASALVRGVNHLCGAQVMATDLRASVSLILAGLAAQDVTFVNRVYHLDRGYEGLVDKLAACGAEIERLEG
ncbi:MAG: UDP-N-acetylglucosamine 1-carboxyvinyltransferase, partial [Pseudomonadota bacterium]|nr:UDP-N-acetylglucosamine 1-carboxyvinyltransferase [Pseudomonadota bacterium]